MVDASKQTTPCFDPKNEAHKLRNSTLEDKIVILRMEWLKKMSICRKMACKESEDIGLTNRG